MLLVFLDGVGLAPGDPARNPLAAARLPHLTALGGGRPPVLEAVGAGVAATLLGLDANLGRPGLPQSGTGQATLLTGVDAVARFGRHFGPWVPVTLRPLVAHESVLARAARAGLRVAFANAYPEELREHIPPGTGSLPDLARLPGPLRAGPPLAALGAGLLARATPELLQGTAVASEIVNDGWREHLGRTWLPRIDAATAGRNLARIAAAHHLTLFAHYATDQAGHRRDAAAAITALERLDAFLGGLRDALPDDVLLLLASDHGNIEDAGAGHTRNPALLLATGRGHAELARGLTSLDEVAPRVLVWLGVP